MCRRCPSELKAVTRNTSPKRKRGLTVNGARSPRLRVGLVLGSALLSSAFMLSAPGCGRRPGPPVPKVQEVSAKSDAPAADVSELQLSADDWPMWRGANVDGISTGPAVPTKWSETENVAWKVKLPGRGHSSPTIVGDRVYLETADEKEHVQSVLCLDRTDGKQLWKTDLHRGQFETAMHGENTQATSTIACDGERLFALFLNDRKIWATALDLDGNKLWQTEVGSFASKFGFSASPTLYKSLVLLAADHQQGGFVAALNRQDGSIVWRKPRPAKSSYASPRVVSLGGKDQLVICGANLVASFDPLTGDQFWSTSGTAEAGVGTLVVADDLLLASGGYPEQETIAVKPDGSVAWRNNVKAYCPSLLAHKGHLYMVSDDGIARCYDAKSGTKKWEKRIGGNFRVSPVLSGGHIIITDMSGKTTVFKADPVKYELVSENHLGTEGFASPGMSKGQLFLRVADSSNGPRQEWLYCIAAK